MNKQSEAKEKQQYQASPTFPMCSNCIHFRSDKIENKYHFFEEKNIHCDIGGFAIKKQGTCNLHEFNQP